MTTLRPAQVTTTTPTSTTSSSPFESPTPEALVVRAWNEAHAKRDVSALDAVYAPDVWFYGTKLPKAECEKRKAAAFAAMPDYTQSLADVTYMDDGAGGFFVTLTKVSMSQGESKRHAAYVYVDDGKIVAEGDAKRVDDPLGRRCITITPDGWFIPNGFVGGLNAVSSLDAVRGTMRSKHLAELRAKFGPSMTASIMTCAGDRNGIGAVQSDYAISLHVRGWISHDEHMLPWATVNGATNVLSWSDDAPTEQL